MNKSLWAVAIAVALAGALLWRQYSAPEARQAAAQPPLVLVHRVQQQDFADRIEALGTLQGRESVTLTASVSETVAAIHFEEGQQVERGALLVSLAQAEEQAQLAAARADLAEQTREVKRLEGLVRQHSAAQTELDQRRTAQEKARHRIDELQATIADRNLRAPFAGVLGLRRVSPGALVTPGTAITTLDDISQLKLTFSVPATALASLRVGQTLYAHTPAYAERFEGRVSSIDSRVNVTDRSIRARALFDNADGRLKPGMLMELELQAHPRRALLVPEEALLSRADNHSVWVLDEATGTVASRPVRIGGRRPGWVEISEGLSAGEQVVREGLLRLSPGLAVRVRGNGNGNEPASDSGTESATQSAITAGAG